MSLEDKKKMLWGKPKQNNNNSTTKKMTVEEKKKMLWGSKGAQKKAAAPAATTSSKPAPGGANKSMWAAASLGDSDRQKKFFKLMGMSAETKVDESKAQKVTQQNEKMWGDLEQSYQSGLYYNRGKQGLKS